METKMISDMLAGMKEEIVKAVMEALASAPQSQPQAKRKFYGKPSDYQPTQGEVNVLEYSDSTMAVYGDLKDKPNLLGIIKSFGQATITNDKGNAREYRATFMRSLQSIELADGTHPCGWLISNKALAANGGISALVDSLSETGAKVNQLDSVASITAARKADKADKAEEPKAPAPAAPQVTKPQPAPKPKAAVVSLVRKVNGVCYEATKADPFFRTESRELTEERGIFTLSIEGKGVVCYLYVGNDLESEEPMYLMVKKCKALTDDIRKSLNAIASNGIAESIKTGKLLADSAAMNAFARLGDADMVDYIWNLLDKKSA